MDKKAAAILVLIVLAVITGAGWYIAWSEPPRVFPPSLPEGIKDWTQYFPGYEAYLDNDIHATRVEGPSMEPTLGDNDLLLWVQVNPAELKVGDIIIYEHPTIPDYGSVVHRIIENRIEDGVYGFRTQGDGNPNPDSYWVENELQGLVIGVIYAA